MCKHAHICDDDVCPHMHTIVNVCKSKDYSQDLAFSLLPCVGSRDGTQVIRLAQQAFLLEEQILFQLKQDSDKGYCIVLFKIQY